MLDALATRTIRGGPFALLILLLAGDAHGQDVDALLREFSANERSSIRSACYGAGLNGPASFYGCLNQKAIELRQSPGEPSLAEFSRGERTSIRSACYGAGLRGPASFYGCLRQKAAELNQSAGEPNLSEFPSSEQASIRSACYGAGLRGPASFYACLRQKAADLRAVRRELGLEPAAVPLETRAPPLNENPPKRSPAPPDSPDLATQPAAALPNEAPAEPAATPPSETPASSPEAPNEEVSKGTDSVPVPRSKARARPAPKVVQPPSNPFRPPQPAPQAAPPPQGQQPERDDTFDTIVGSLFIAAMLGRAARGALRWLRGAPEAPPAQVPPVQVPPAHTAARTTAHVPRRPTGPVRREARAQWSFTDQSDVRDAITGQPLRLGPELHRCTRCQVYYHRSSVDLLERDNGGRCVSCGDASVSPIHQGAPVPAPGPTGEPDVTTLTDYRAKVGEVVIFEGRCVEVLPSRSGSAFAVMFEHARWTQGFKLVIRTASVSDVGGLGFIRSLLGRTVRVRGRVDYHEIYGYEIAITNRSMILEVR